MSKKIAFMGTPTISGQILKSLYQNGFDIAVVYTQPPVASNRGHRLNKSPVHIMAEILNIPVRTPIVLDNNEEKNFLKDCGLLVADFQDIQTYEDLKTAHQSFEGKGIIKTRRFGYDGKGQWRMTPETDLTALFHEIDNRPTICEAFIPFDGEVSVVAARSVSGQTATFDMAENIHENHILRHSFVPTGLAENLKQKASDMACHLLMELDYIGVLT